MPVGQDLTARIAWIDLHAEIGVDRVRAFGEGMRNGLEALIVTLGKADGSDVAPEGLLSAREKRAAKLRITRNERGREPEMRSVCASWTCGTQREVRSEAS